MLLIQNKSDIINSKTSGIGRIFQLKKRFPRLRQGTYKRGKGQFCIGASFFVVYETFQARVRVRVMAIVSLRLTVVFLPTFTKMPKLPI